MTMTLAELILDPDADVADVANLLDALPAASRWGLVRQLDRAQQRALYRMAAGLPVGLEHFVGDAGPLTEVVHDGLNTLPVPPPLRRFQKRFCRPGGPDDARLFGYNEGPTRRLLGPGYFVAVPTDGHPEWAEHGGVVVDYFRVPDAPVADGWPPVVPNSRGLQRFVYHQTRDFLRGVSAHVSIGAATKDGKPLDHYFVLCRRS
jgi:hypothetical protein